MRLAALLLPAAACTTLGDLKRIVAHGPSDIDDARLFASRSLDASPAPFHFRDGTREGALADEVRLSP